MATLWLVYFAMFLVILINLHCPLQINSKLNILQFDLNLVNCPSVDPRRAVAVFTYVLCVLGGGHTMIMPKKKDA